MLSDNVVCDQGHIKRIGHANFMGGGMIVNIS